MKSVKLTIFISLLAIAMIPVSCTRQEKVKPTKNVILMVPDGVSTSVLSLVRWYNQQKSPQNVTATLATDPYLCGMVRQSCSDSPVPASPAAMTSFMTGYKVQGRQHLAASCHGNGGRQDSRTQVHGTGRDRHRNTCDTGSNYGAYRLQKRASRYYQTDGFQSCGCHFRRWSGLYG